MAIRIVIAEDSFLVREGVRRVLDLQDDLEVVDTAADLPQLLASVAEHSPDVVVTDIRMPPTSTDEGIQAATGFQASRPGMGVVVLSQYAEPAYATPLLATGSTGRAYLLKERVGDPQALIHAVRTVAAGGSVIDPAVVEALVTDSIRAKTSPLAGLTARERDVLAQIAQGKSNAAVGAALFLTERAVEKHINALFAKLGLGAEPDVNRRVMAVLLYLSAQKGGASTQQT
ncbi:response regulator transcription factor [Planotetraspora kaengkrachanensis]|uniref:DNA-binding response regulator n=1 Tax=Planotetraspora kaengkrachanensis TaxID=575193 RepID=A0A8J3V8K2_9ACTN|nr:response regulator transcription factor [Planotetraspora kaengkrachanensis]GIG82136.1 DNA-binding response regulator [Planotetraspora kaengkrachanensis]